jgi:hypothetical protein
MEKQFTVKELDALINLAATEIHLKENGDKTITMLLKEKIREAKSREFRDKNLVLGITKTPPKSCFRCDIFGDCGKFACSDEKLQSVYLISGCEDWTEIVEPEQKPQLWTKEPVVIMPDGRCDCSCGDVCALGKTGSHDRCTADELINAGVKVCHQGGEPY